uniref:Uncharacterized protein n=4 Tax=unclassified Arthrobacter TaxID=235627 RepID=I3W1A7_9MICC|nr:hypothetical protein [Arthrobacter sp. J3.37]AFK89384.1 hypothetical protein [Arthrobacter sp. J3.40]AFK89559.1 hypothetical protein [Arthrobacter sp. J3.49]AFK89636.1 hypothetical protein [Arthrobacter sp. J3.53]
MGSWLKATRGRRWFEWQGERTANLLDRLLDLSNGGLLSARGPADSL